MKELKFRAWDNKNRTFVKATQVCRQTLPTKPTGAGFRLSSKFILSQFTGLKDKNGRDIYEGDILSFKMDGFTMCPQAITYHGNGFWLVSEDGNSFLPRQDLCEVIGNIYENPELIR